MSPIALLPHQKEGVSFLLKHHYSILGDGMGLGKTAQAIEVAKLTGDKTLILCPSFLQGTWRNEIKKFGADSEKLSIISYSSVTKHEDEFKKAKLVIADESQYLKNLDANRTLAVHHFIQKHKPNRLIMLTGTAIKNRVGEFYSPLALCAYSPNKTNGINVLEKYSNYYRFCDHFSHKSRFKIRGRWITKYEGHKNVDELREILKGKYLRRKASEVLDLPPIIRKDIILDDSSIDYRLLEAWEGRVGNFSTAKVVSALSKVKFTIEYSKNLLAEGEGPLVIFSDHIDPATYIGEGLAKVARTRVITGSVSMSDRDIIVDGFQQGKLDVIVATIGSLSVGVTLTASRNMIFNDLPWVPSDLAQAEKRIHRISQEGACTIHRLLWGKVDVHVARQLDQKIETLAAVL